MPQAGPARTVPDDRVELGVALLAHAEDPTLDVAEAVDRLEAITTDPAVTREILDTAERRGIIDRDEGILQIRTSAYVSTERQVVKRAGEHECRRCGASLSAGHFIQFEDGELGPFGPECVRAVIGRD